MSYYIIYFLTLSFKVILIPVLKQLSAEFRLLFQHALLVRFWEKTRTVVSFSRVSNSQQQGHMSNNLSIALPSRIPTFIHTKMHRRVIALIHRNLIVRPNSDSLAFRSSLFAKGS